MPKDLDEAYHEYLWGEASPRSFAQKAKFGGTKTPKERVASYVIEFGEVPR